MRRGLLPPVSNRRGPPVGLQQPDNCSASNGPELESSDGQHMGNNVNKNDTSFEEVELSAVLSTCFMEMTEVHMSTDQNDGSEIIAPSRTDKPFSCYIYASMGCRRHWMASLGHVSSVTEDEKDELTFDCRTAAAAAAAAAAASISASETNSVTTTIDDTNNCLTLWFSYQPDRVPDREPSTLLVFKLARLANNLRRIMYSRSSTRNRGSTLSKTSENRSEDSRGSVNWVHIWTSILPR
uniref:Uncharacterized protein n=1 Tax=Macrostomum lignano TaxID=282301 RepID=A0A1I8F1I3_9PLAT